MQADVFDVLVIGAGVSGIGMGCALKTRCPNKKFAILERRERLGGTWDLFRFPGVRSDSDMHSYAYQFRPWRSFKVLGDGASIRSYLAETAREFAVEPHIIYGVEVNTASWSSATQLWTLHVAARSGRQPQKYRCRFLVMGTGYFDYAAGYRPSIPGLEQFAGPVVHPQQWPENLDYRNKRVIVIGSGATAITLVPALAQSAAQVTMLQRSPSYLLSLPTHDRLARLLCRFVPSAWAFALGRRLSITVGNLIYYASRRWPERLRKLLVASVRKQLQGSADMRDFEPHYGPWDQRLCIVSDGDLFERIRAGKVQVVTDEVECVEADHVRLKSGRSIEADIVVTATGFSLKALGGIDVRIDGKRYQVPENMLYKGVLLQGLPNLAWIVGYVNASWTIKAEMAATYICNLLKHMDANGHAVAIAHDREGCRLDDNIMSVLDAGYVKRSGSELPRQGSKAPWRVTHNQRVDRRLLIEAPIEDGILSFERARRPARSAQAYVRSDSDRKVRGASLWAYPRRISSSG